MKDIVAIIMFYLVWNSEVHKQYPTLIPVLATVYIIIVVLEFVLEFSNKK
jgi:hypothetical protein